MRKWKFHVLMVGYALAFLFQFGNCNAGTLNGSVGLVTVPTAEMPGDREVSFGMNWLDRNSHLSDTSRYNTIIAYATVGYLPFLEISPCLTRYATNQHVRCLGLGARSVTIRLRLFSERTVAPSVVLGLQDPLGIKESNASYLVGSKSFRPHQVDVDLHLGYGVDWIEAKEHQFLGLFGGVSLSPKPFVALMLEHDSDRLNCGMRIFIFNRLEVLLAFLDFDKFSGGMSYRFGI
jgi:hypothetical protein